MKISPINNNFIKKPKTKAIALTVATGLLVSSMVMPNTKKYTNQQESSDKVEFVKKARNMKLQELINALNEEQISVSQTKKEDFFERKIREAHEIHLQKKQNAKEYKEKVLAEDNSFFSRIKANFGAFVIKTF